MVSKVKVDIEGKNTGKASMFKKNIMKDTMNHVPETKP